MPDPVPVGFARAGVAAVTKLVWNGMQSPFGSKKPKANPVMDELDRSANEAPEPLELRQITLEISSQLEMILIRRSRGYPSRQADQNGYPA
jgi:hypothetical protein